MICTNAIYGHRQSPAISFIRFLLNKTETHTENELRAVVGKENTSVRLRTSAGGETLGSVVEAGVVRTSRSNFIGANGETDETLLLPFHRSCLALINSEGNVLAETETNDARERRRWPAAIGTEHFYHWEQFSPHLHAIPEAVWGALSNRRGCLTLSVQDVFLGAGQSTRTNVHGKRRKRHTMQ